LIPSSDREAADEHRGELYQEKAAAGDKSQIRDIDTQTLGFPALVAHFATELALSGAEGVANLTSIPSQ
jgi:hypothetical protein